MTRTRPKGVSVERIRDDSEEDFEPVSQAVTGSPQFWLMPTPMEQLTQRKEDHKFFVCYCWKLWEFDPKTNKFVGSETSQNRYQQSLKEADKELDRLLNMHNKIVDYDLANRRRYMKQIASDVDKWISNNSETHSFNCTVAFFNIYVRHHNEISPAASQMSANDATDETSKKVAGIFHNLYKFVNTEDFKSQESKTQCFIIDALMEYRKDDDSFTYYCKVLYQDELDIMNEPYRYHFVDRYGKVTKSTGNELGEYLEKYNKSNPFAL